MPETSGGYNKTIYLPKRYIVYIENNIESFGDYVKSKLDEDMSDDVSLLEQRVTDIKFEESQLTDKIKRVKERDKKAKQKLGVLIEKTQGLKGVALKEWATGWRSEILACGETVESFCRLVEAKKAKA